MTRVYAVMLATAAAALMVVAADPTNPPPKWYARGVKKVEGAFTPAEAKPGETVTFTLTIELNEGFHTYPTVQPEKAAAGSINVIEFPSPAALVFVGKTEDPKDFTLKEEPLTGTKVLRVNTGKVVYTRKAVVSPKAPAGEAKAVVKFGLSACEALKCYPVYNIDVLAKLKVLDGPAVPVEKAYAEEVAKALEKK